MGIGAVGCSPHLIWASQVLVKSLGEFESCSSSPVSERLTHGDNHGFILKMVVPSGLHLSCDSVRLCNFVYRYPVFMVMLSTLWAGDMKLHLIFSSFLIPLSGRNNS